MGLSPWLWVGVLALAAVVAWRIRDRAQARRHQELRLAVRQRTNQLERGQLLEGARNRILEMLVSNEPLEVVLDAICRMVAEQVPDASCLVLVKRETARPEANRKHASGPRIDSSGRCSVRVGAASGAPREWVKAIGQKDSVPFEVWRQACDFRDISVLPAWRGFVQCLSEAGSDTGKAACAENSPVLASAPGRVCSLPIGDTGAPIGAILLMYPETAAGDNWESPLQAAVRLAQIAIEHRLFCDELAFRAHYDSLTGLPNRNWLDEELFAAIVRAQSRNQRMALLYVDVDEFKQINDRFGHRTGDEVLAEISSRIEAVLRPGDTVARIGGDEFNVLLPDIGEVELAGDLATRILAAARQPVSIGSQHLTVTVSVGIAIFPDDGQNAADLQREADAAMYYAKSLGKNRVQTFADNAATLDKVRLERDMRRALAEGWFQVHYQPKFTAAGRLAGIEALLRLNHPTHGSVPPVRFIPVAEASGLIVPIGAWVLDEVCRQIAEWRERELDTVVVAVNVSAVQISQVGFAKSVEACLARHSVPTHCLELELTESILVDSDSEEHRQMQMLRAMGICISIDDFGTGFSSLSYLNRLQVDAVKLDRSFVQTIDTDDAAQHVVRAMIAVARQLGLEVIAEGVETEAQRAQLVAAGCPVMQGYLFARPGPPETIEPLLHVGNSAARERESSGDLQRLYDALEPIADREIVSA